MRVEGRSDAEPWGHIKKRNDCGNIRARNDCGLNFSCWMRGRRLLTSAPKTAEDAPPVTPARQTASMVLYFVFLAADWPS